MTAPSGSPRDPPAKPRRVAALAGILVACAASPASAAATDWVGDGHAAVRLITAEDARGSGMLEAGIAFRFAPGWHGYWRTPGDAGIPPAVDWAGTSDLEAADVSWPAPSRLVVSGLENAVYIGNVVLPVHLTFRGSPGGETRLRAAVDYAACSNVCVPLHADLALDLPAGASVPSPEAPMISASRAAVPGDPAEAGFVVRGADIVGAGAERRLVVDVGSPAERLSHPDLFVEGYGDGLPPAPAVVLGQDGRTAVLTVPLPAGGGDGPAAVGPLRLTMVDGARATSFPGPAVLPLPVRQAGPPGGGDRAGVGFIAALLLAVLGGLVLNLMPCVLPVLSLKLAGVAGQAGADRGALRVGFAATALGIVMSFLLLAAALIGLKASGRAIGWGIQFQQPAFLAFMALVTTAFTANLFDWLHVGVPDRVAAFEPGERQSGWLKAFLTGALATLLATPCSAPFVGTAAGFALSGGPTDILAVFACLGLGMALPYVAAALLPGVAGWLPRPGRWMGMLRRILGGLLLGTTVWLLAVLSAVVGPGAAASVAVALAALLAFLGWSTRALPFGAQGRPRAVAFGLTVAAAAVAVLPARGADSAPEELRGASAFDPDAVAAVVARGGTVLVDVSAAWCLTCKVNEVAALDNAEVRGRLARPGTVVMRADWTRPDAGISRYLASFDRFGIPLDVVYGPGRPAGEALPELLTPGIVLAALDRAAAKP